jgi:hypothetical protein
VTRIRIVRDERLAHRRLAHRLGRFELGALVLVAAGLVTLPAAAASGTGSVSATINVGSNALSLTVSPSTFDYCTPTAPLTFPNGPCPASSDVTVTFGNVAGHVDVNGADAVPLGGGTHWTLCGGTSGGPACTGGASETPGVDQYAEGEFIGTTVPTNALLGNAPICDLGFGPTCGEATAGQSATEKYIMVGPSSSSSTASSFSTSITWTALP